MNPRPGSIRLFVPKCSMCFSKSSKAGRYLQILLTEPGLHVLDLKLTLPADQRGPAGSFHNMGTTRMHADPKHGVVDADARVHGVDNLYMAGSSVFPTSGYANPTLTIVALTLRLSDHLKRRLS